MARINCLRVTIPAGITLLSALLAWHADAQTAATPAEQADRSGDSSHAAGDLQEIIVTAEKTSVSLQKAPAAITVVDGDALATRAIQDMQQAQVLFPSAHISQSSSSTQIFIRGIGQRINTPNADPLAIVNLNDVPVPREAIGGSNLYDVARIEGLPGPQGTLYGSTAIAGVVNIELEKPNQTDERKLEIEKGNYNSTHLFGMINNSFGSDASARLAVNYNRMDGFLDSGSGSVDDLGMRLSGKAQLGDRLSISGWGTYSQSRGTGVNAVNYPFLNPQSKYNDAVPLQYRPYTSVFEDPVHNDTYIGSAHIDYDANVVRLSLISSYLRFDGAQLIYGAGSPVRTIVHIPQTTNELRISGDFFSRLSYVGGIYQSNQKYLDFIFSNQLGNLYNVPYSRLSNLAGYSQGTYSISDSVRATFGGRYGTTQRTADGIEFRGPVTPGKPYSYDKRFDHFDWKAGLDWDLTPTSMAYGVVQTGYAPGTYNTSPSAPGTRADLDPTKLLAYTLGIKNRFFDRKLQLNLESFYYDYKDLVVTAFNATTGSNQIYNAKQVEIYGLQLDSVLSIDQWTELHAGIGFLHARDTDFVIPELKGPALNYGGLTPPFSPEWTANLGASRIFPLPAGAKLTARVDSHIEAYSWDQFDHAKGTLSPGFTKTDLALTYAAPSDKWHIGAYARNVENSWHFPTLATGGTPGPAQGFLDRPRTFGVRGDVIF